MRRATSLCFITMLAGCGEVTSTELSDSAVMMTENDEGGLTIDPSEVSFARVGDAFQVTTLLPADLYLRTYDWKWFDMNVTASLDYLSGGGLPTHAEAIVQLSHIMDQTLEGEEQEGVITGHILVQGPEPDLVQEEYFATVELTMRAPKLPFGAGTIRLLTGDYSEEYASVTALFSVARRVSGRTKLALGDVEITATHIYQSDGVTTTVTTEPFLLSEQRVRGLPFSEGFTGWFGIGTETPMVPDDMAWFHTSFTATGIQ